jgi:hypothetical protein
LRSPPALQVLVRTQMLLATDTVQQGWAIGRGAVAVRALIRFPACALVLGSTSALPAPRPACSPRRDHVFDGHGIRCTT